MESLFGHIEDSSLQATYFPLKKSGLQSFAFAWISLFLTYFSFRKSSVFKDIFSYMYQLNFPK